MTFRTRSLWKQQCAAGALAVLLLAAGTCAAAQGPRYEVGDRVECDPTQMGTFKKGTILPFPKNDPDQAGRFYYVKLDGSHLTDGYLCMATHMRPLVESTPSTSGGPVRNHPGQDNQTGNHPPAAPTMMPKAGEGAPTVIPHTNTDPKGPAPKMAGGLPTLPGTAWKIDWGIKGGNVQRFLFCRSGRWEVVSSQLLTGGALSMGGTYTVQGSSLVAKDANGGKVTNYRMAWKDGALELDSGKTKMRLYDPVATECK